MIQVIYFTTSDPQNIIVPSGVDILWWKIQGGYVGKAMCTDDLSLLRDNLLSYMPVENKPTVAGVYLIKTLGGSYIVISQAVADSLTGGGSISKHKTTYSRTEPFTDIEMEQFKPHLDTKNKEGKEDPKWRDKLRMAKRVKILDSEDAGEKNAVYEYEVEEVKAALRDKRPPTPRKITV